jgi:hypothetical protein
MKDHVTIFSISKHLIHGRQGRFDRLIMLPAALSVGALLLIGVGIAARADVRLVPQIVLYSVCPALMVMPFMIAVVAAILTTSNVTTSHYDLLTLTTIDNNMIVYGFFIAMLRRLRFYLILAVSTIPALSLSIAYLNDDNGRRVTVYRGTLSQQTVSSIVVEPLDWGQIVRTAIFYGLLLMTYWGFNLFATAVGMGLGMRWRTGIRASVVAPFALLFGLTFGNCALACAFAQLIGSIGIMELGIGFGVSAIIATVALLSLPMVLTLITIGLTEAVVRLQQD